MWVWCVDFFVFIFIWKEVSWSEILKLVLIDKLHWLCCCTELPLLCPVSSDNLLYFILETNFGKEHTIRQNLNRKFIWLFLNKGPPLFLELNSTTKIFETLTNGRPYLDLTLINLSYNPFILYVASESVSVAKQLHNVIWISGWSHRTSNNLIRAAENSNYVYDPVPSLAYTFSTLLFLLKTNNTQSYYAVKSLNDTSRAKRT